VATIEKFHEKKLAPGSNDSPFWGDNRFSLFGMNTRKCEMSVIHVAPRRLVPAAGLALGIIITPAVALVDAHQVSSTVANPAMCTISRVTASAWLNCPPNALSPGGALSEQAVTASNPGVMAPSRQHSSGAP
jgi:hypothetical protein